MPSRRALVYIPGDDWKKISKFLISSARYS